MKKIIKKIEQIDNDKIIKSIYSLFLVLFIFSNLYNYLNNNPVNKNLPMILAILSCVIAIIIVFYGEKILKKLKLENIFLICALFFGFLYIIICPLFTGSDEHNHYYRIYELSEMKLLTPIHNNIIGGELPQALVDCFVLDKEPANRNLYIRYQDLKEMLKVKINNNDTIKYGKNYQTEYVNAAIYSPFQYLPHTIGFIIGKITNSPYLIGIFGRITNLLMFIFLSYFAIKIIPKGKMFYFTILLSPVVLSGAATLSCDAFTNALVLLFIAYLMKYLKYDKKIDKKSKIILFITSAFISVCKIVYLPIILLIFMIPSNRFKNKKEKNIYTFLLVATGIILNMIWMKFTSPYFEIYYSNSKVQEIFILKHLIRYILIVFNTYGNIVFNLFENMFVGKQMYHTGLQMPTLLSLLYVIFVFLSIFNENKGLKLKKIQCYSIVCIQLIIIALITTALYIQCTATFAGVGYDEVVGIQGRYFIPLLFLFPFITNFKKEIIKKEYITIFVIVVQIIIINTMICHFFI